MCQWHPFLHSSVHTLAVVVVHKPAAVDSAAVHMPVAVGSAAVVHMPVAERSAAVVHKLAAERSAAAVHMPAAEHSAVVRTPAVVAEPAEQICSRRCRQ